MRRAHVRELLKDVSVGPEAGGWTLIFRQEGDPVVDHVISEDPAVGILGGFRWVETQHVGKCPLLVDRSNRFLWRVIAGMSHEVHELVDRLRSLTGSLALYSSLVSSVLKKLLTLGWPARST